MRIKENVERILERIEKACSRVGRDPKEVKLLAATKTRTPEEIREAYHAGIRLFGENRVQEAKEKIPKLQDISAEWHMIGHLQTNKAKHAIKLFDVIETIDRESIIIELEKRLKKENRKLPVLIEVKVSPEESKHGVEPQKVEQLTEKVLQSENLKLIGLMTVPPYDENLEIVRKYFQKLRKIKEQLEEKFSISLPELSMGMSYDFEIAIEEGATIVRIGSAIFGPRCYT